MGKKPRNLLKEDVVPTIFKHSQGPSRKSVSLFETERESERERARAREREETASQGTVSSRSIKNLWKNDHSKSKRS